MTGSSPIFFAPGDQAYRLKPDAQSQVVSRFPDTDVLASGWLLGEQFVKGQADIITHRVGKGTVVTYGTEVGFRTWDRGSFKLLFNGMYNGPASAVTDVAAALR